MVILKVFLVIWLTFLHKPIKNKIVDGSLFEKMVAVNYSTRHVGVYTNPTGPNYMQGPNMFSHGDGPRHDGFWLNRGRGTLQTAVIISDTTLCLVESGVIAAVRTGLHIGSAGWDKQTKIQYIDKQR